MKKNLTGVQEQIISILCNKNFFKKTSTSPILSIKNPAISKYTLVFYIDYYISSKLCGKNSIKNKEYEYRSIFIAFYKDQLPLPANYYISEVKLELFFTLKNRSIIDKLNSYRKINTRNCLNWFLDINLYLTNEQLLNMLNFYIINQL